MHSPQRTAMRITLNGEPREVSGPLTMQQLLDELHVPVHTGVAVLRNGEVLRRADWAATALEPDDDLEIVRATAGG